MSPTSYGTLFRLQLRPDIGAEALQAHLERWQRELGPRFPGSVLDLLMKVEGSNDEFLVLHLFRSRQDYDAMAGDTDQDRWYHDLVAMLTAPPTFTDVTALWKVSA